MRLIDGRAIGAAITAEVTAGVAGLPRPPVLAVVVPTADEATAWYVRSIERAATRAGIECRISHPSPGELIPAIDALCADAAVAGIICQTPLPPGLTLPEVGAHIAPAKDVDGANPASLGRLAAGLPCFAPATAAAVLEILHHEQVPLAGRRAVVVGRSTVVGKPAALLLLAEHATVTICHTRTENLAATCAAADILVASAGRAHLLGAAHIGPGATVIDVGTNPGPGNTLLGDVDSTGADHAGALTPVPGGVGPVTTALLLRHTLAAATHSFSLM